MASHKFLKELQNSMKLKETEKANQEEKDYNDWVTKNKPKEIIRSIVKTEKCLLRPPYNYDFKKLYKIQWSCIEKEHGFKHNDRFMERFAKSKGFSYDYHDQEKQLAIPR